MFNFFKNKALLTWRWKKDVNRNIISIAFLVHHNVKSPWEHKHQGGEVIWCYKSESQLFTWRFIYLLNTRCEIIYEVIKKVI
jgi:hypothetical protein